MNMLHSLNLNLLKKKEKKKPHCFLCDYTLKDKCKTKVPVSPPIINDLDL